MYWGYSNLVLKIIYQSSVFLIFLILGYVYRPNQESVLTYDLVLERKVSVPPKMLEAVVGDTDDIVSDYCNIVIIPNDSGQVVLGFPINNIL